MSREGPWAVEPTRSLLETLQLGFVAVDAKGSILAWNPAAAETFGWRTEEVLGRSLVELIVPPRLRDVYARNLERAVATGDSRLLRRRLETEVVHRDGHELPAEITIGMFETEGEPIFHALIQDISERREALRVQRRLAEIVESSEDAIFSGSLDGTIESWNQGAERIYGYSAEEMIGESVTRLLPAEDFSSVEDIRERLLAGEPVRALELQDRRSDGTLIDVSISLSPLRDSGGELNGVFAIVRDISERKAAERLLAESQQRFAGAFEAAPVGMALVSPSGDFLAVNHCLCELVGRSGEELMESNFQEITHPDDLERDLDQVQRLLAGKVDSYEMEKRYLRPDRSIVWGLLRVVLVRDADGEPAYFVSQILDITNRKQTEEDVLRSAKRLQELAVRDPLTGLRNLPDLRSSLETELARARRYDRRLAVAVFDIEGFTQINRIQGREYGDRVLRAVAQLLEGASREPDLAARTGDDSFALILPETDHDGAEVMARRIAEHLAALEHLEAEIAFGVASFPAEADSATDLLSAAERNLAARAGMPHAHRLGERRLSGPTAEAVRQVLRLAREQLGVDLAFLTQVVDDKQVYRALEGDGRSFADLAPGAELPWSESYCRRMVDGTIPNVVGDVPNDPELGELPVTAAAEVGAYLGVPVLLADGELYGTLCGVNHSRRPDLTESDLDLMRFLSGVVSGVLSRERDATHERDAAVEFSGIHALLAALEARDQYTGDHSRTVVTLARAVAERLGVSEREMLEVEQVALLHDIGKVGIPDSILLKRGPLSEAEWELMRQHPAVGERIVANTQSLAHLAPAVRAEHERFDGRGYPDGLRGEQIPIASRITLACDAYDAMTTDRPYRQALSEDKARRELVENAGTQFDPTVVDALQAALDAEVHEGDAAEAR